MPSYAIQADFENIDSPELIAASLAILQKEGWEIIDYTDVFLRTEKSTVGKQKAELTLSVSKNEVTIQCNSDLAEQANQFIVDSFAESLHKFISSPSFDNKVRNLKHHYFMNNPLQDAEVSTSQNQDSSVANTIFSFRKNFRVTPALILMNAVVFIGMVVTGVSFINPTEIDILNWGANFRSFVLQGEWWRLITCCFIHIGIIHILFNMWALYSIGIFLERMIGSWRFAFAYTIAGLAGSMNSIIFHYATPSAGASGAIFGMFGLFLALLTTNILEKGFRKAMLQSIVPMILFNLLLGTSAMIDNAGHIGGLTAGLICGYLYAWHYKNPKSRAINILTFVLPAVLVITAGFIINKKLPDSWALEQQKIIKDYRDQNKKVYHLKDNALKMEQRISYDKDSSIMLWDQAIAEMKKVQEFEMDERTELHDGRLMFYLEKRKQEALLLKEEVINQEMLYPVQRSIDSILIILKKQ